MKSPFFWANSIDGLFRSLEGQVDKEREQVTAIEVELSQKTYTAWKKIFMELVRCYHAVQYYVHASIKASLAKAVERFQNEEPGYGEPSGQRRQCISIHDLEERL